MNITKIQPPGTTAELDAGNERGIQYLMDAVHCYAKEWAAISGAYNSGDALDAAKGTKQRILAMVKEDAGKLATALKDIERMNVHHRMMGLVMHNMTVGNQAAWIAWRNEGSAEEAMRWIENGLIGPGLIPGEDDEDEKFAATLESAQAYYDAHIDGPLILPRKDEQAARITRLESVLARLLASDPATGECDDDELRRAASDTSAPEFVQEQAAAMLEARAAIHGTQVPLALMADWKPLVDKAIAVLQRNATPSGISDRDAMIELHSIFDGPEYRTIMASAGPQAAIPAEHHPFCTQGGINALCPACDESPVEQGALA